MIRKILISSITLSLVSACNLSTNNLQVIQNIEKINNQVQIKINTKSFSTKFLAPISPASVSDIKSYKVGLTNNILDPLNNLISDPIIVNISSHSVSDIVTFKNIPVGGPYYAVIQALDENGNILNENQNNINYSLSVNSVTVNSDLSLNLPLGFLQVILNLRSSKPSDSNFKIINSTDEQTNPNLSLNELGTGLLIWTNSQNGEKDIYAQKMKYYNKIGLPFKVNDTDLDLQEKSSIKLDAQGNGLIIWKSIENSSSFIRGKKIENNEPINSDFLIPPSTAGASQESPSLSIDSSGNGLVVWQENLSTSSNIYFSQVNNYTISTNPTIINQNVSNQEFNPKVSINNSGSGFVIWQHFNGSGYEIYAKKIVDYNSTGNDILIGLSSNNNLDLKLDQLGNGLITWGISNTIKALKIINYDIDLVNHPIFNISSEDLSPKSSPKLYLTDNANGMVLWQDSREITLGGKTRIYGKKIQNYLPQGSSDIKITNSQLESFDENLPEISINTLGNGISVWNDNSETTQKITARHIINFLPFVSNIN